MEYEDIPMGMGGFHPRSPKARERGHPQCPEISLAFHSLLEITVLDGNCEYHATMRGEQ
jgi:hypothetical protein